MRSLLLLLLAFPACKKDESRKAPKVDEQVAAVASYDLLEEVEGEDSYVGSEMETGVIDEEIEYKARGLSRQVTKAMAPGLAEVKKLIKDKMLEKFDVNSDGLFNKFEQRLIKEQIAERLGEFHSRHPGDFDSKKEFICKIVKERTENLAETLASRPLYAGMVQKCQNF